MAEPMTLDPLHAVVIDEALTQGVNPALALALVQQESSFDPSAVSPTGVIGLAQVTNATGAGYGQTPGTRTDPAVSARAGLGYFKHLLDQHQGDVVGALGSYNGGTDPHFAQHVLSHYPKFAQYETLQRGRPPTQGGQTPRSGVDLDAIDAGLKQEWQGRTATGQGTPPAGGLDLDAIDTQLKQEWQGTPGGLSSPRQDASPGALPDTGGPLPPSDITMDIAKPSTGNEPTSGARRQPENLDADLAKALEPTAFSLPKVGSLAVNVGGAMGGAALGALTSPITGPVGPIVGEALGSLAGHKVNQALGWEPGSATTLDTQLWPPSGDVLALGIPPVVRGLGALAGHLPGAAAARHEEAMTRLQELPDRFAPARPSAEAYADLAAGTNPTIPAANLTLRAMEVINRESRLGPSFRSTEVLKNSNDLLDLAKQYRGNIPIELLYEHQQRVGLLIRKAQAENWPQLTGLKQLYGAIYKDIDSAVAQGVPEAVSLREATQSARREFAQHDLAELVRPGAPGVVTRADGIIQVNGGKLMDRFNRKLATDETFANTFSPSERVEIQNLFHEIEQLPRVRPAKGAMYGSGLYLGRGTLTYGLMNAITGDPKSAAIAAGLIAEGPRLIAMAVMSPTGRQLLRQYLNAGQILGPGELAALRTATTGGPGQPVIPGTPTP